MLEDPSSVTPSESAILELALRSPQAFSITKSQTNALRLLFIELQSTLIDHSSKIQKVELDRYLKKGKISTQAGKIIQDAIFASATARAQASIRIRKLLSIKQLDDLVRVAGRHTGAEPFRAQAGIALNGPLKDQKVVELETAGLVAERLLNWGKIFAAMVVIPAALLVATLTVIGISKYSDFTALVADSEKTLKSKVIEATENAGRLERQVASLATRVGTLEKLGRVPTDAPASLQELFNKFQNSLVSLGYSPGSQPIDIVLINDEKGTLAYYSDNKIFVAKSAVADPEIIYREYLHHVLYSQSNLESIGPEQSALESGLADYFVASYIDNPRPYRIAGLETDLNNSLRFRNAKSHGDRFVTGNLWAAMFWQLRGDPIIGQKLTDQILFLAWFNLPKNVTDANVPIEMISRIRNRESLASNSGAANRIFEIMRDRGFPLK